MSSWLVPASEERRKSIALLWFAPARAFALRVSSWILVRTIPGPMMKKLVSGDSASRSSHILISMILEAQYAEYDGAALFVPEPEKNATEGAPRRSRIAYRLRTRRSG